MVHRGSLNNVAVDVLGNVRVCFFELEFWKRKHVKCRATAGGTVYLDFRSN